MTSRTLGPYQFLDKLGEGGMGQVYRARDTRLNREVALKVLPDALADDPEYLARFTREAETLAALNHPNIAHVYGFETDGTTRAIVMELVPGRVLSALIAGGPMPQPDALAVARQIALALEAAHERGVVHRDLKPDNIKITDDGVVKVLDFGLARTFDALDGTSASGVFTSHSPTRLSPALTQIGTILGTAAYMAPEQARAKPVDKRADLWAFGCVLYEMLTGRPAFSGDDIPTTLAKVLEASPDFTALPATTAPSIRTLLRRCLVKDRRDRLGDATSVRIEIDDALHASSTTDVAIAAAPRPWWWRPLPWPIVAVAVAVPLIALLWPARQNGTTDPISRFDFTLPPGDSFPEAASLAFSPDGRTLFYSAVRDGVTSVFRRRLDEVQATIVEGTQGGVYPFVFSDGGWLAFGIPKPPTVRKVPVAGGTAVNMAVGASQVLGIDAWPNGDVIVGHHSHGLFRVPAAGGDAVPVFQGDEAGPARFPVVLPDDRGLLFTLGGVPVSNRIAVLPAGSTTPKILTDGTDARYLPTGHIVFWRDGSLWAAPFDLPRLELSGAAVPVVERVRVRPTGSASYAWARNGTLAYIGSAGAPDRTLVWVDRRGDETPLTARPGPYASPRLSPDERRIVMGYRGTATEDIWLHDIARGVTEPFIAEPASEWLADWTGDGERIVFTSRRAGPFHLFAKRANGLGDVERIADNVTSALDRTSHGDLLFANGAQMFRVSLSDRIVTPILHNPTPIGDARVSPDGNWLAYASLNQVWVRPYPDVDANRWPISTDNGRHPRWSSDSRTIFYQSDRGMMAVPVRTSPAFAHDAPTLLFDGPYIDDYDVTRDGRFLMVKEPLNAPPADNRVIIVLNWFTDLKARLAAR